MNRFAMRCGFAVMLVCAVVALLIPRSITNAQDGAEATIQAQQTEIADLQTQVAELQADKPTSTVISTPSSSASGESSVLGGNAHALLPSGTEGALDVAVVGTYDGNILPIVIRNNTEETIGNLKVSAVARGDGGSLIAAGGDQGFRPSHLVPGGYALGYIYFDGIDLPPSATFEFEATSENVASISYDAQRDLSVQEAEFLGNRVVGLFVNKNDVTVDGPMGVFVACFSDTGQLIGFEQGYTDKEHAGPGDTVPFQVDFYRGTDCTNFLVASSGWSL